MQVGARYYDPTTGSFLTRDTDLSQLAYVYCGDDPIDKLDPSGHGPWGEILPIIGGAIGGALTTPETGGLGSPIGIAVGVAIGRFIGGLLDGESTVHAILWSTIDGGTTYFVGVTISRFIPPPSIGTLNRFSGNGVFGYFWRGF